MARNVVIRIAFDVVVALLASTTINARDLGQWVGDIGHSVRNERGRQLRRPRNDTLTPWGALFPVRPTVALPITASLVLTPTVLFTRAPFPVVLMNDHAGL